MRKTLLWSHPHTVNVFNQLVSFLFFLLSPYGHRFPATKGNPNANRPGILEGDVDTMSYFDPVYWCNQFFVEKLGPAYNIRDWKTWSNEELNPDWARIKDDRAFHWGSPSAMSQCFNDRATRAGYPPGHLTFHSLSKYESCLARHFWLQQQLKEREKEKEKDAGVKCLTMSMHSLRVGSVCCERARESWVPL